jgi:hypothetical protein
MITIDKLWESNNEHDWKIALEHYWSFVRPENLALERELNELKLEQIIIMDQIDWYNFLHDKYFCWKYTAPNRYVTTSLALRRYKDLYQLDSLFDIKKRLLNINTSDISAGLSIAKEIHGLGIAGASGLLSIMYPNSFATVDQFAVKALCKIPSISESNNLMKMKPDNLTLINGMTLIGIMRRKAKDNNINFDTDFWTPRKIDMILWASRY